LRGELTYATCNELAQALDIPVDGTGRPCTALDASDLEFFDSSGIRARLIAAKRA
jgi:anti-anti-sigma regulatory factor